MRNQMKIAICIPTFNQSKYLRIAVQSALEQSGVETEVWVSDDASTDETPTVMRAFENDPRVHYHRHATNQGIAANAGWVMEQPDTPYLVRLDSDDVLKPDYCRSLSEMLRRHPDSAVAHGAVEEIDEHGKHNRHRRLGRVPGEQTADAALAGATSGYRVAANICMFRTSALRQLPYVYRPGMNFAEDWDLFVRLAVAGWNNVYCSDTLAEYRVWSDAGGYRSGRKASEIRGILRLFDETLQPEWDQRGWETNDLWKARRRLALTHAESLTVIPPGTEDYQQVYGLLENLAGDGEVIESHLAFRDSRIGRFAEALSRTRQRLRSHAKSVYFRVGKVVPLAQRSFLRQ
ncbi:Chondroitin synthase [Stieleria maiorica]|uniref:Chondroitin synthase n=1 Tax=Stieleria maiorica TaxID=2795974 RepID=A0A5B9MIM0_9BACT|nr:glycosyltransferase family 2 protein [Stieleria maiorica]QEG01049.1 Chondroitin synthase [Stieleria maiorica]